jgi:hypothetical protein
VPLPAAAPRPAHCTAYGDRAGALASRSRGQVGQTVLVVEPGRAVRPWAEARPNTVHRVFPFFFFFYNFRTLVKLLKYVENTINS